MHFIFFYFNKISHVCPKGPMDNMLVLVSDYGLGPNRQQLLTWTIDG